MSFFGGSDGMSSDQKINISAFENYLNDGEVSKVVVVNKKTAQVTLTETALTETKHSKATKKDLLGRKNSSGPHYQFEVGNLELFQKKLEAAEEKGISFSYEFETVESRWLDVLLGFLPLILIIAVWLFIMRRMSGGGAGGGGAQIFNIGKSKAKLFDEKCALQYPQNPSISIHLSQAPQHAKVFPERLYLPLFERLQKWHELVCWSYLNIRQSTCIRCFLFHVNLER